jgi:hypothetical protein
MTDSREAFERFCAEYLPKYKGDDSALLARGAALLAWKARQPEIDALRAEIEGLENMLTEEQNNDR